MKNPTAMTTEELADELRKAETVAKNLGPNWQAQARLFRLRSEMAFRKEADVADFPYQNESSQSERKRALENDRRVHSSYLSHAQASIDEDRGGRYAATGQPATVVGASPIRYPQQPSNSPWARDSVPDEPALGYDVNQIEPVGELHERAGSAVPVEPTNRMDTAGVGGPAAKELDRRVITPPVAGPTKGFRRRM
jgi:hypothetical protein